MIPGANHTHELVIVRPDDGRAQRWNIYPTRAAADAERVRLAKHGFYCVVRPVDAVAARVARR